MISCASVATGVAGAAAADVAASEGLVEGRGDGTVGSVVEVVVDED
jgi:hypothetical protein